MLKKIICNHCQGVFTKNPRLKGEQHYCGSTACQQGRKNQWEKAKLENDAGYRAKRAAAKKKSYSKRGGDKYQSAWRKTHPGYCHDNREKQVLRKKNRKPPAIAPKIVNTDALFPKGLVLQGIYALLPCGDTDAKKIVNTDALFVQLYAVPGLGGNLMSNSV